MLLAAPDGMRAQQLMEEGAADRGGGRRQGFCVPHSLERGEVTKGKAMISLEPAEPPPPQPPTPGELGRIFRHCRRLLRRRGREFDGRALTSRAALFRFGTGPLDEGTWNRLQTLLALGRPNEWRERVAAAWTVGRAPLTLEQQEAAVTELSGLVRGKRTSGGTCYEDPLWAGLGHTYLWFTGHFLAQMGMFFAVCLISLAGTLLGADFTLLIGALLAVSSLLSASLGYWAALAPVYGLVRGVKSGRRTEEMRVEAARALGRLGAAEGVSSLLALSQNRRLFHLVGREALKRTLPALTPAHEGTLDTDAVPNLCRLLMQDVPALTPEAIAWERTVLCALAAVGNARAVKPLEAFLASPQEQKFGQNTERAEAALAAIRKRIAQATDRATLLRGTAPPPLAHTLLRPSAFAAAPEETAQLLRPSAGSPPSKA